MFPGFGGRAITFPGVVTRATNTTTPDGVDGCFVVDCGYWILPGSMGGAITFPRGCHPGLQTRQPLTGLMGVLLWIADIGFYRVQWVGPLRSLGLSPRLQTRQPLVALMGVLPQSEFAAHF